MYTKLVIFFLMSFGAANLHQESHFISFLELKLNDFYEFNSGYAATHKIMNKLLNLLGLDKDLANSRNIRSMVPLLHQFHKIEVENRIVYEELRNISEANITKSDNVNLEKIFQRVIKSEIDHIKNIIRKGTQNEFEPKVSDNRNQYMVTKDSYTEFNEVLSKLSDLTLKNLINPILKEIEVTGDGELTYNVGNNTHKVKTWLLSKKPEPADNATRRIYKGKKTKINNFPFLVSVHIMSEFICAGSIISKDKVITAASCLQMAYKNKLYRDNPRTIFVRVGSDYTKHSGELVPIVEIIFHPQYDPVTLKNNVAIIRMLEKLKKTKQRNIKRIQYDRERQGLSNGDNKVTILGWGDKDGKHKYNSMQKVSVADLDIYDLKDCEEIYSKYYVTEKNFCAGFVSKGGGACKGDVGGPAVMSGQLVGLISFGPTVCGMRGAPTVFTKIGFYAEWIDSVIKQEKPKNQRPAPRQLSPKTTSKPELVNIPVYTTVPHKNVRQITKGNRLETTDYPAEIVILRNIIQEFVLNNRSVIDYLLDGDIFEEEDQNYDTTTKSAKGILVPINFIPITRPPRTTRFLKYFKDTIKSISEDNYDGIQRIIQVQTPFKTYFKTTRVNTNYDDLEDLSKKTTLRTLSASYEISSERDETVKSPYETSSYYEEEVPIEETKLIIDIKTNATKTNYVEIIKSTTKKWSQIPKFLSTYGIIPTENKYYKSLMDLSTIARNNRDKIETNESQTIRKDKENGRNLELENKEKEKQIYAPKMITYSEGRTVTDKPWLISKIIKASRSLINKVENATKNGRNKETDLNEKEKISYSSELINYYEEDTKYEDKIDDHTLYPLGTTMLISDEDFDYK